jgi:hypothetical protein
LSCDGAHRQSVSFFCCSYGFLFFVVLGYVNGSKMHMLISGEMWRLIGALPLLLPPPPPPLLLLLLPLLLIY